MSSLSSLSLPSKELNASKTSTHGRQEALTRMLKVKKNTHSKANREIICGGKTGLAHRLATECLGLKPNISCLIT